MSKTNGRSSFLAGLALPLAFFVIVLGLGLGARAFEYDSDEGLNLEKALLVLKGHRLYSEIGSNQPPVLTWLLYGVFKVVGPSPVAGRCLVLVFSAVLLWSLFVMVRRLEGLLAASLAVLLVIGSAWYFKLSFSVMIGLPSLALGVAALAMVVEYRFERSPLLLVFSAVLFAASMQTKFSGITVLAPLVLAFFLPIDPERPSPGAGGVRGMVVWLIIVLTIIAAIVWVSGETWDQVIRPHREAALMADRKPRPEALVLLRREGDLIILSLVSLLVIPRGFALRHLLPLIWFGWAAAAIQCNRPVWAHYTPLLTVPLAWSAALGARPLVIHLWNMLRGLPGRWGKTDGGSFSIPSVALIVGILLVLPYKYYRHGSRLFVRAGQSQAMLETMRQRPDTRWVFTDRMIYPFYAGLSVPPSLAPTIHKRRHIDPKRDYYSLEELRRYRPEQVLIGRLKWGPEVMGYIEENYQKVLQVGEDVLYVRRSSS